MERLSFTSKVGYNATEAAIHMARYQLAAPYCKGRRVLDIACGEGYGAFSLKHSGAKTVDAVDISAEAIKVARLLFAAKGITHHVGDAERVEELFDKRSFDVVVSLETIEHVRNPDRFLRSVRRVAKDDAVIIISCPNDHWYYQGESRSNPFHVRKYTFEAFRKLTTAVLGDNVAWGYGVPIVGFGNIRDDLSEGRDAIAGQTAMLDFRRQASAIALPPRAFANVGPRNCSYFVGVWGGEGKKIYTSAFVPISMDQYSNLVSWDAANLSPLQIAALERENANLKSEQRALQSSRDELMRRHDAAAARELEASARIADLERVAEALQALERESCELKSGRLRHVAEIAALEKAVEEARANLEDAKRQHETARIRALALAKELDLSNCRIQELGSERERLLAEAQERPAAEALLRQALAVRQEEANALRDRLEAEARERESFRIQALALRREIEVASAHIESLTSERERLSGEMQTCRGAEASVRQRLASVEEEVEALRGQLDATAGERERFRISGSLR